VRFMVFSVGSRRPVQAVDQLRRGRSSRRAGDLGQRAAVPGLSRSAGAGCFTRTRERARVSVSCQVQSRRVPRLLRVVVLLLGWLVPQFILYGPALFGDRVQLPLETLRVRGVYSPSVIEFSDQSVLSDAVFQLEPQRQLAIAAVRAGHVPLWDSNNYLGAPFLAANQPAIFSPFRLVVHGLASPRSISRREVWKALVAGLGAFLFFRAAFGASFWAAALGSFAFPLSGFILLWSDHPLSSVALFLPWLLYFCERTLARPRSLHPAGLA